MQNSLDEHSSWLDRPVWQRFHLDAALLIFLVIVLLAVGSRFYNLGARVMSHDENSHVYYSWKFFRGQGFAHDPLMHGPFQFHIVALTYFMFGDNDFTARIPAVLFSIATVAFVWNYRRYLGRAGTLVAALLMLISPYMLFYGRYVRNEAFIGLYAVITLWALLRYLETGQWRYTYWLVAATVMHFITKETSFIYAAEMLIFLALVLIYRLLQNAWLNETHRNRFIISLIAGLLFFGAGGAAFMIGHRGQAVATVVAGAATSTGQPAAVASPVPVWIPLTLLALAALAFVAAVVFLLRGYTLDRIREERSFDLLMLIGTLVLPQLSAFPIFLMGWNIPTNAAEVMNLTTTDIFHIAAFLIPLIIISFVIGIWWNRRLWLINAAMFYAIFIVFQTSVFTNGAGFFTGIIGSLGYWLKQQGVNRGSQPWYYYLLIQVPVYEYLPAIGTFLAFGLLAARKRVVDTYSIFGCQSTPKPDEADPIASDVAIDRLQPGDMAIKNTETHAHQLPPVFFLLCFWSVMSMIAFSIAGEKMPWLTVHITLPLILNAGWAIGYLIDTVDWRAFQQKNGWIVVLLLPVFFAALFGALGSIIGTHPPFMGKTLDQLRDTSTFLLAVIILAASGAGIVMLVHSWLSGQFRRIVALSIFALLALLTTHTAIQSSYYNYNDANELLVYAHSAGGVKLALSQIEEIARRTSDGLGLPVAFDNETSYPFWWYLRNYTDQRYFGADPTRSLRDVPLILVGDANYGKIEPVVGQGYDRFDYIRLWWPNQDYFDLTPERVWSAIKDARMRDALFQIWLNRDYTLYGQLTGKDMSLPNWNPSARMRLYIRKDVVAKLWNYGAAPTTQTVEIDPYKKQIQLSADRILGGPSTPGLQLARPRGLAVAPDGSLYVADTDNARIVHLSADGVLLQAWGKFADISAGPAPAGTFDQPWSVAVGADGSVYVADTWNHRIQKFSADGKFITMWGYFGQGEKPEAFWGPRAIAIDTKGRIFVTDTGNKRIVVFDADGKGLTQFGSAGLEAGQFDEPVGLAVDTDGKVYVADTWNQRMQVFTENSDGTFSPSAKWDMSAWYGQSLDNKPLIGLDHKGHIFVADPEGYRVLEFKTSGEFIQFWGDAGSNPDQFKLVGGLALDTHGGIWVSDSGNNRLMHFVLPAQ